MSWTVVLGVPTVTVNGSCAGGGLVSKSAPVTQCLAVSTAVGVMRVPVQRLFPLVTRTATSASGESSSLAASVMAPPRGGPALGTPSRARPTTKHLVSRSRLPLLLLLWGLRLVTVAAIPWGGGQGRRPRQVTSSLTPPAASGERRALAHCVVASDRSEWAPARSPVALSRRVWS